MLLEKAYELSTQVLPPTYYLHAIVTGVVGVLTYAFAQGNTTNRERDLHARAILITGGFTPLGLTLISSLAARGAHIIALSEHPLTEHSIPSLLIPVLRTTTKNEQIFAEYADLSSPESIRAFCTKFLTGDDHRLDGIIFAHEYRGLGSLLQRSSRRIADQRDAAALATFLIITLLLPKLLVAPVERDIRIINVVNPFYAASAKSFTSKLTSVLTAKTSQISSAAVDPVFLAEGFRALRTAVFTRHLQRVLNALPNKGPAPDASKDKPSLIKPPNISNIIAVTAAPGVTRAETISPLLSADRENGRESFSYIGFLLYTVLYPIIWLIFKSSAAAEQTILHVLFLPTPFKRALAQVNAAADGPGSPLQDGKSTTAAGYVFEEVLKPGSLYRECAVVNVKVPALPPPPPDADDKKMKAGKDQSKQKETEKDEFVVLEDDGELGGESLGRVVWEWYETRLKDWEAREKVQLETDKKSSSSSAGTYQ